MLVGRSLLIGLSLLALAASTAKAAEPRPWLCRDKPVFSSDQPMSYEVDARKGRQWRVFLMQFSPGGTHDGFDIVKTIDPPRKGGTASGHLAPGRYFAVALYHNASGYWICPGYAHEQDTGLLGIISSLCFSDSDSGCPLKLTLKPEGRSNAPNLLPNGASSNAAPAQ